MKTVKVGERTSYPIKNANIKGFFVTVHGIGSAVNTTPVHVSTQIRLNAKLNQGAFNDTILDGRLTSLWRGTAGRYDQAVANTWMGTEVITAAAAEVVGVSEWTYKVMFPTVICLNGSDQIDLEIDFPAAALTDHNTSTSYLTVQELEGIGNQFYIPRIMEKILPALETEFDHYYGDNVIRAVLMGSGSLSPIGDGVTKVEIFSDRRNCTVTRPELVQEAANNESNAIILIEEEHDQCRIRVTMDGSLNAAGDLKLVTTQFYTDQLIVATGKKREAKHLRYAAAKI